MDETGGPRSDDWAARGSGVLETAQRVVTDPQAFYASMPRSGGLGEPAIFAVIMFAVTGAIYAILSLVGFYPGGFIGAILMTPIFGMIGLAIGAAILFLVSKALGGDATYESDFRILAYTTALWPIAAVASIVPLLPLLVSAYQVYVVIIAVIAVDRVPEQKAWTVLGGIGAVLLLISLLATLAAWRAAPALERAGSNLEKTAAELERATEHLKQKLDQATDEMKQKMEEADDQ